MVDGAVPRAYSRPVTADPLTAAGSELRQHDWFLNAAVGALCLLGVLLVWSATYVTKTSTHSSSVLKKDVLNLAIALIIGYVASRLDYRSVRAYAPIIYLAGLLGLLAVLSPLGATINGAKSWLYIGSFSLEPAEFTKLALVIGLAVLLGDKREGRDAPGGRELLGVLAVSVVPLGLIMLQPDLGTAIVIGVMILATIAVSGTPGRWLAVLFALTILAAVAVSVTGILHGYQQARLTTFIHPNATTPQALAASYNVRHAQIAIGSGGFFGQGLLHGTLTNSYGFVPEQRDDFIMAVAGEELGFIGCAAMVALFGLLLWRAFRIAANAADMFGRLVAVAVAAWLAFQVFENIGMCLGIMPVTGVPLPFISYGGSSLFACLAAVGLLQNIHLHTRRERR